MPYYTTEYHITLKDILSTFSQTIILMDIFDEHTFKVITISSIFNNVRWDFLHLLIIFSNFWTKPALSLIFAYYSYLILQSNLAHFYNTIIYKWTQQTKLSFITCDRVLETNVCLIRKKHNIKKWVQYYISNTTIATITQFDP